jgi:hypothetical protein
MKVDQRLAWRVEDQFGTRAGRSGRGGQVETRRSDMARSRYMRLWIAESRVQRESMAHGDWWPSSCR